MNAGKPNNSTTPSILPGEHAEMLLDQRRRELALHHNRIVALLVKSRKHGLHGKILRVNPGG